LDKLNVAVRKAAKGPCRSSSQAAIQWDSFNNKDSNYSSFDLKLNYLKLFIT